ncbi:MAG TPA: XdhC family protein, partial [Thermoanaerobaculia bacterium]
MRDVLDAIERWRAEKRPVALATVVATWGSAPRVVGGKMAIAGGGQIAGSVSGGCVESA